MQLSPFMELRLGLRTNSIDFDYHIRLQSDQLTQLCVNSKVSSVNLLLEGFTRIKQSHARGVRLQDT